MADTKTRDERASARERRRSLATKPFEELDGEPTGQGNGLSRDEVAKALKRAAVAALAGGLGGAVKAVVDRRRDAQDDDAVEPEREALRSEATTAATDPGPDDGENDERDVESSSASGPETDEAPDESPQSSVEDERDDESDSSHPTRRGRSDNARGASSSDVAKTIEVARTHIEEVLGREVETVSGIERADGSWIVTVEVVDIRRIPESTDVLSSYEVVLDNDRNLVQLDRKRRYRRSQVEEM